MNRHPFPFRKIYGYPFMLALITACGLFSALFGDGLWDGLSWIALAVPLVVALWKYTRAIEASWPWRRKEVKRRQ